MKVSKNLKSVIEYLRSVADEQYEDLPELHKKFYDAADELEILIKKNKKADKKRKQQKLQLEIIRLEAELEALKKYRGWYWWNNYPYTYHNGITWNQAVADETPQITYNINSADIPTPDYTMKIDANNYDDKGTWMGTTTLDVKPVLSIHDGDFTGFGM